MQSFIDVPVSVPLVPEIYNTRYFPKDNMSESSIIFTKLGIQIF
jgi:hypothetical protein